jgi:hypothetical protein
VVCSWFLGSWVHFVASIFRCDMASLLQSLGIDMRRGSAGAEPRAVATVRESVLRMPGHKPSATRPSSHALKGGAPSKWRAPEEPASRAERNSADDVTMSGKVEWWMEEVALERSSLADEERERLARRRAARLAASEEQERRIRQGDIARAMEMVERMEEREIATRMEEAERRRRMKEADDHQRAALREQQAQRSSALRSFVQERDRILSNAEAAGGTSARVDPAVLQAMEREMQRRAAAQMVSASGAPVDDSSVSSALLLQRILAKFAGQVGNAAETSGDRSNYPLTDASTVDSAPFASHLVDPTPRTEFSRRVKPVGLNNFSMDLSQEITSTSTMNSTQDSAINPLMSFGSPPRMSPGARDKLRMGGVTEEDSMLLSSDTSILSEPVLNVRVSGLETRNLLPSTPATEWFLELRCGVTESRTRAASCAQATKFDDVLSLPIAGEEEVSVSLREWDRAASRGGKTCGRRE